MPKPTSLYVSTSVLFDIDENENHVAANVATRKAVATHKSFASPPPPQPPVRRVSIQAAPSPPFHIATTQVNDNDDDDDPVLGDEEMRFHRQSSTINRFAPTQQPFDQEGPRKRAQSRRRRRHSVAPWPICGLVMPVVVLRLLTSLVVVPVILAGLIWMPRVAVVWLCILLVCMCLYEYSWLAFRIHYQLLSTYCWYERAPSPSENNNHNTGLFAPPHPQAVDETDTAMERLHFQSFASRSGMLLHQSRGPLSHSSFSSFGLQEQEHDDEQEEEEEEDTTIGGEGGLASQATTTAISPLQMLELAGAATAVSSIAAKWCGSHEWLAKLFLAALTTAAWTQAAHYAFCSSSPLAALVALEELPSLLVFDVEQLTWVANFVACLAAFSSPNMRFAVSMLIQVNVFFGILLNSLVCPLVSLSTCSQPLLSPMELFAIGAVLIFILRAVTSTSPADMVIITMVDLLGYLFIIGNFALLIGVVDLHNDKDIFFARVLLLLVAVLWTAQLAGYACDRLISHLQLPRYRLLPRRLAVRLDVEATVFASCVGVLAMALGGRVVGLPTPMWVNVMFAFAGVLLTRLGSLFIGLLKRAAGLRRCSRALPGFGGVFDMASTVLFASVVVVKLYLVVKAASAATAAVAAAQASQDEQRSAPLVDALSVGFGGLVG